LVGTKVTHVKPCTYAYPYTEAHKLNLDLKSIILSSSAYCLSWNPSWLDPQKVIAWDNLGAHDHFRCLENWWSIKEREDSFGSEHSRENSQKKNPKISWRFNPM